jgi:hypothetical protein
MPQIIFYAITSDPPPSPPVVVFYFRQVQTCVHCYGQGSCVNGMCRCFDNYDGESCAVLLCPNNCNLHGVCINVEGTPACLCNPPYGGVDCLLPQCMNQVFFAFLMEEIDHQTN